VKRQLVKKVKSLGELSFSCQNGSDRDRYMMLACLSASNLGGQLQAGDWYGAIRFLSTVAAETEEQGVVEEVNFCRDLV
jgi:hypothetical protein